MRQETIKKDKMAELTTDGRLLVVSHLPMAYAMAWRMKDCGVSLDDLRQEGCLGLCEAALRYDGDADVCFATYARPWCRKMMLLAIDAHRMCVGEQDEEFREDPEADEDQLRSRQRERIDEALGCLLPKEQAIIRQYYGLDCEACSLTEIAASLGFSKTRASVLHFRALRKLRRALRKRPLEDYLTPWHE